MNSEPIRVLIPFNTVSLYGMERAVIATFDLLRPEVRPHFLMSRTTQKLSLPVLSEIKHRDLDHSFLGDRKDWPRMERPASFLQGLKLVLPLLRGNLNVLKASLREDAIYVSGIQYFYFAILAAVVCRLRRNKVIFQFHDLVNGSSRKLRLANFLVTDVIHNSKLSYENVIQSNEFLKRKRNFVIPPAIRLGSSSSSKEDLSKAFHGRNNILFVGQVSRHKGVDILLDAFNLVSKSRKNVTLHVVGGCDDAQIRNRLETASPGNECRIRYWGYREDALELLKMSDVYVQPSPPSRFSESFGLGLVEAMSLGIPSVCFRSGAFTEIMVHEQTGLICDDERPETLADSFERLLVDAKFREECGRGARQHYLERYAPSRTKLLWLEALSNHQ